MKKFNITAEIAAANFESLAALLISTAPTEKASAFAEKKISEVRARGAQWMADNAVTLQIQDSAEGRFCPVEDNRNYYMTKIQSALMAA